MKMLLLLSIIIALLVSDIYAQKTKKKTKGKIVYKYKKYEKFDFEDLEVKGDSSTPGDLSINPRFNIKFKNNLPDKKRFDEEMWDSVDSIQ
jgi:hypothetical protein